MATAETAERIVSRMSAQSKPYGTSIAYERGRGVPYLNDPARFDRAYSFAPLIHSRIVAYSGESLVNRTPPPCARVVEPAMPSVSELDVGLRRIRLFSGFAVSTTF